MSDVLPRVGLTSLSRLRQANRALKRAVEDCRRELAERERAIETYQGIVAENERSVRQYQEIVAEHEQSIARYQEIAAEHERAVQSIQQYQEVVAENERSIQRYQAIVAEQEARLGFVDNLDQLKRQIAADSEATAELTVLQSRTLSMIHAQLDGVAGLTADLAAKSYVNRGLDELGDGAAELLNYANGDRGFAAQAGVRFDWPIRATFRAGQVSISDVSERIVEIPFALGALASFAPGSRILDVGASGSFLALSLACLGHEVIALDRQPYPIEHPRLRSVAAPIDEWSGPGRPLDAVVCISAPADVGLDQAETERSSHHLRREHVDRFRRWLRPDGVLVLSAPVGAGAADSGGQVRDADGIAAFLDGWKILEQRFAAQLEPLRWTIMDAKPAPAIGTTRGRAVVLLRATPTQ